MNKPTHPAFTRYFTAATVLAVAICMVVFRLLTWDASMLSRLEICVLVLGGIVGAIVGECVRWIPTD